MQAELKELTNLSGACACARWHWSEPKQALQIEESYGLGTVYVRNVNKLAEGTEAKMKAPIYRSWERDLVVQNFNPKRDEAAYAYKPWGETFPDFEHVATLPLRLQGLRLGVVSLYFRDRPPFLDSVLFNLVMDRIALGVIQDQYPAELEVFLEIEDALNRAL